MSLYLTDETLQFLRPCFDYDAINRPKARFVGIIFIWISILTSITFGEGKKATSWLHLISLFLVCKDLH